jgi:hypothetical protein
MKREVDAVPYIAAVADPRQTLLILHTDFVNSGIILPQETRCATLFMVIVAR